MHFKDLLRHRNGWMGFAMLWIMLFHTGIEFPWAVWNDFRSIGFAGVDICFFASGIGCFYSLCKDPDPGRFMKRRLLRIMPTYVVFIVLWLIYQALLGRFSWQMALGNLLGVQHFTALGNDFNWYVSATLLFYLLAPYFKVVIDRTKPAVRMGFLVFLFLISVCFWGSDVYIITASRVPVFYMGMLFGNMCRGTKKISPRHIAAGAAMFLGGIVLLKMSERYLSDYMWSWGLNWYPFALITVPLCGILSWLMDQLQKTKITGKIVSFLALCGQYSFELCLMHLPLVPIVGFVIERLHLEHIRGLIWLAAAGALAVGCRILRWVTEACVKLLEKAIKDKN